MQAKLKFITVDPVNAFSLEQPVHRSSIFPAQIVKCRKENKNRGGLIDRQHNGVRSRALASLARSLFRKQRLCYVQFRISILCQPCVFSSARQLDVPLFSAICCLKFLHRYLYPSYLLLSEKRRNGPSRCYFY